MFNPGFSKYFLILMVIFCLGSVTIADSATLVFEEPSVEEFDGQPFKSSSGTRSRATIKKNGNWVVTGNEFFNGDTIILTGNLYVAPTGTLTMINVRLIMNCSTDGQYMIQVNASNGELTGSRTTIRSINSRFTYKFKVNGTMTLARCTVTDLWGIGVLEVDPLKAEVGGIEIRSDSVIIKRSIIRKFKGFAITCMGSQPKIHSTLIEGNLTRIYENAGIYCAPDFIFTQSPEIIGNNFTNCSVGIRVDMDDPIIKYNNISTRQGYNLVGITVISLSAIIPANPIIANNNIINNGVGIGLYQADGTLQNNEIKGNGLGILGWSNTNTEILGNTIENNLLGGINLTESSPDIHGNDILGNGLVGISCDNSDSLIDDNTIVAPRAQIGIACFNGSSPTIQDNDITSGELATGSEGYAIKCNETSSPTISNNEILVYSNGIGISSNGASPKISENNISVEEDCTGVYVDGESVVSIEDNNIYGLPLNMATRAGESIYGIHFDKNTGISKSKANNNTIENFSYGIMCLGSSDIDIEDNLISNVVEFGVFVLDSYAVKVTQIELTDDIVMIENSSGITLSLVNSKATSLNSSIGQRSVDKDSQLTMMWYLHLKVTDDLDAPIEDANVTIYNSSNIEKYKLNTPSNGQRNWIRCIEYIEEDRDSDGVSELNPGTPHTIIAEKASFHPGNLVTELSESKTETLILQSNQMPTPPSGIGPIETHNLTPNITWLPGSDPDDDVLTYHISIWEGESSITGNLIVDDNITKLSYFNQTPKLRYGTGNNTYYLELNAKDDYGGVSGIISHNFYAVNHPPTLGNLSDKSVYAGEVLWFYATASDPDTDPVDILNFSEDSDKFEIDPETGEVYWVTTKNDVGIYEVEFKLEDGNGGIATKIINISVISLNLPPLPDAGEDYTVEVNTTVTLNGTGSLDEDGNIIGYEWKCITYNVTFENANSSAPSFTPTVDGLYIIQLRVMDNNLTWSDGWDSVNITVLQPMKKNSAPVLKNGSVEPAEGTDKINYTFTVEYYDKDNDAPTGDGYVHLLIGESVFTLSQANSSDNDYRDGALFTITLDAVLLGTGNHTFRFVAYDGLELANGDIGNHTGPTINPYKPKSKKEDDDKELQLFSLFWMIILIAIISIIIVIVIVALVLDRKKRDAKAFYAEEPYDYYDEDQRYDTPDSRRGRAAPPQYPGAQERAGDRGPPSRRSGRAPGAAQKAQIDWDEDRYPEEDYDTDEDEEEADWSDEEEEDEADWEE